MQEEVLRIFGANPQLAVTISLLLGILVAVLGVVPSVFLTAANILFFGFWPGTAISFAGEALGAAAAFLLYRKGFKKKTEKGMQQFPKAKKLVEATGREAFILILSLRLLPFVPSGLVSFAAAIGKVSLLLFLVASSLGKIPALLIEAWSVYQVSEGGWQGKLILGIAAVVLIVFVVKRIRSAEGR